MSTTHRPWTVQPVFVKKAGQWFAEIRGGNGQPVFRSLTGYANVDSCWRACRAMVSREVVLGVL